MTGEPVVIVGAGPTGALLGIELARRGAEVRIIEKASAPPTESRAGGVHSRTLELFARLGIAEELVSMGHPVTSMSYYSGTKRIFRVDYGYLDGPYPFMLHVPQYETQRVLDRRLQRLGVPVERGVKLVGLSQDATGVRLTTEAAGGRQVTSAAWVVGCDGAHSTVREQLEMPFDGEDYDWEWLGADVEVDWAFPESGAHIFASPAGVLACFPFGGGRWRVLTSRAEEATGDRTPPALKEMRTLAGQRGPASMQIDNPTWLGVFRVSRRSAPHYRQGRVFLAGDAVHVHSPAAGQGMNTGLGDAANLGWKLGLVATGQAPATLLETYEPERAPVARGVIALTHRLMRTFDPTAPCSRIRDGLLPRLSASRMVQRHLTSRLGQHAVTYRGGPLAPRPAGVHVGGRRPVLAGDRAPQVTGLYVNGVETSVFDLISRPEHTVLVLDHARADVVGDAVPYEGTLVVVSVGDPDGRFAKRFGIRRGSVCAVRPDGHVGYIGEVRGLRGYLSRCLLAPAPGARVVVPQGPGSGQRGRTSPKSHLSPLPADRSGLPDVWLMSANDRYQRTVRDTSAASRTIPPSTCPGIVLAASPEGGAP